MRYSVVLALVVLVGCGGSDHPTVASIQTEVERQAVASVRESLTQDQLSGTKLVPKAACVQKEGTSRTFQCRVTVAINVGVESGIGPVRVDTQADTEAIASQDGKTVLVSGLEQLQTDASGSSGDNSAGQDSSAKSDARNMVSQVESCFTDAQDYAKCRSSADLGETGLDIGPGEGQVEVTKASATTYVITAHSESGDIFTLTKRDDGTLDRTCTPRDVGGCLADGTW